jgi:hypothetical protein
MTIESMFRLYSFTVLGLVGLAFGSLAFEGQWSARAAATALAAQVSSVAPEFELESLKEVEAINSGKFRPYEMGSAEVNQ